MTTTLPPPTSSSQQPLNPEDEDGILDEYDQYSLAHPYVGNGSSLLVFLLGFRFSLPDCLL